MLISNFTTCLDELIYFFSFFLFLMHSYAYLSIIYLIFFLKKEKNTYTYKSS